MATLFGKQISDSDRARYDALSNFDKLNFAHYHQEITAKEAAAAKTASLPEKPWNWSRYSSADRREWFLLAQREAAERK